MDIACTLTGMCCMARFFTAMITGDFWHETATFSWHATCCYDAAELQASSGAH
jgi:hypothetical protein